LPPQAKYWKALKITPPSIALSIFPDPACAISGIKPLPLVPILPRVNPRRRRNNTIPIT